MECRECHSTYSFPGRMIRTRNGRCIHCDMPVFLSSNEIDTGIRVLEEKGGDNMSILGKNLESKAKEEVISEEIEKARSVIKSYWRNLQSDRKWLKEKEKEYIDLLSLPIDKIARKHNPKEGLR